MSAPRWDPPEFARRLAALLEMTGLSDRALSRESGVHFTQIHRWRNGVRPAYDSLVVLAAYLHRVLPSETAAAIDRLFYSAGYAVPAENMPAEVAENLDDHFVMVAWKSGVPEEAALGAIRWYLNWRDSQPERQASLPGLPGLADSRH